MFQVSLAANGEGKLGKNTITIALVVGVTQFLSMSLLVLRKRL